jgi:hypothetical protein
MGGSAEPGRAPEHLDLTASADEREHIPGPRAAGDDIVAVPARPGPPRRRRAARIAALVLRLIRRGAPR